MINSYHNGALKEVEYNEDIPYDLSYDDMDTFVRSCGVILPEAIRDIESNLSIMPYV